MVETTEVFGEKLEAPTREELRKMMFAKLREYADTDNGLNRELATKRIDAKLAAKQRL